MPQPAGPYAERPRRSGKPEGRASLTARIWSSIAVIVELPVMPVPNCTSDPCAAHQAGIKSACLRSTLCDTRKGELRTRGVRTPRKVHPSPIFNGIRAVAICAAPRARRRGSALAAAPPSAPGASFSAVSPEPVARVLSDLTTRTRAARTSSWGYTLHQPDHRPPPLSRTPARGAAVLAMPLRPAPRTHEPRLVNSIQR